MSTALRRCRVCASTPGTDSISACCCAFARDVTCVLCRSYGEVVGTAKRKSAKSSAFSKALKLMNKGVELEEVVAGFTSTAWSILHIRDGKGEEAGALRLQSL